MHEALVPHPAAEQWYSTTHVQKLTSSDSLGWVNMELDIAEHGPVPELQYVPYDDHDVISFLLDGTMRGQSRIDGILRHYVAGSGMMFLIPRHTEFASNWDAPWTNGGLRLHPQTVGEAAAAIQRGDPDKTEMLPTFFFTDPLLYHLGVELANELRSANPYGLLYAESLTNTLTLYLLRHYSTGRVVRELSSSGLTPAQLCWVDEYIHAHLDQKISLADLANCVHLSVPHFTRMFRATTHRPPYRYVLELRLERARVLLQQTRLPPAEVAYRCGFSSQSHFTTHFTRHVGVSPARFARGTRQQRP
jgi:AraC family transcriptional regulator